jgi:hypothetical protein
MTPLYNADTQGHLLESHLDARAADVLVPNLEILLVEHSKANEDIWLRNRERIVTQAPAVAVAREQAGHPLKALIYWCPREVATELIGSREMLPQRPTCVFFSLPSGAAEIFYRMKDW